MSEFGEWFASEQGLLYRPKRDIARSAWFESQRRQQAKIGELQDELEKAKEKIKALNSEVDGMMPPL